MNSTERRSVRLQHLPAEDASKETRRPQVSSELCKSKIQRRWMRSCQDIPEENKGNQGFKPNQVKRNEQHSRQSLSKRIANYQLPKSRKKKNQCREINIQSESKTKKIVKGKKSNDKKNKNNKSIKSKNYKQSQHKQSKYQTFITKYLLPVIQQNSQQTSKESQTQPQEPNNNFKLIEQEQSSFKWLGGKEQQSSGIHLQDVFSIIEAEEYRGISKFQQLLQEYEEIEAESYLDNQEIFQVDKSFFQEPDGMLISFHEHTLSPLAMWQQQPYKFNQQFEPEEVKSYYFDVGLYLNL